MKHGEPLVALPRRNPLVDRFGHGGGRPQFTKLSDDRLRRSSHFISSLFVIST